MNEIATCVCKFYPWQFVLLATHQSNVPIVSIKLGKKTLCVQRHQSWIDAKELAHISCKLVWDFYVYNNINLAHKQIKNNRKSQLTTKKYIIPISCSDCSSRLSCKNWLCCSLSWFHINYRSYIHNWVPYITNSLSVHDVKWMDAFLWGGWSCKPCQLPQEKGLPPTKSWMTRTIWESTEKEGKKHVYIFYLHVNFKQYAFHGLMPKS